MCIKAECPQAGTRARWCTQSRAEADGIAEEEQLGGSNKCHCLLKGKGHQQIHKAVSAFVGPGWVPQGESAFCLTPLEEAPRGTRFQGPLRHESGSRRP